MSNEEKKMLEAVYEAEIYAGIQQGIDLYQTKSKVAKKLAADGLLVLASMTLGGRLPVIISGYRLTHAGRRLYCATCQPIL